MARLSLSDLTVSPSFEYGAGSSSFDIFFRLLLFSSGNANLQVDHHIK